MSFEETLRSIVREEIRSALREELAARPAPSGPELLTIAQAAASTGLGVSTIRTWLSAGKLNRYGAGRAVRVNRAELDRVVAPKPRPQPTLADIQARAEAVSRRFS